MQKIFTLFLGMIIALSAAAAPAKVAETHEIRPLNKVTLQKLVAKAPLAVKEDAEQTTIVYEEDRYMAAYGIYLYILVDEDGVEYYFSFDSEGTDPVVNGQTYTLDDMNSTYSYLYIEGYGGAGYESVSFTKTVDGEGNVMIVADISLGEGYDFHLVYDSANLPEAPEGGDYELDSCQAQFFVDTLEDKSLLPNTQYVLTSSDDQLKFYFDIILEDGQTDVVPDQVYTQNDMIAKYTAAYYGVATVIEMDTISFVKTLTENGFTLAVFFRDSRGFEWNLSYTKVLSDMTFDLAIQGEAIAVTPSNETENWDWTAVPKMYYDYYGADYFAEYCYGKWGEDYAAPGSAVLSFNEIQTSCGLEAGENVLIVWGVDGGVSTPAAAIEFTIAAEGIEDVIAAGKAAKVVRNGQVVILKGDKAFNLQGAQVK